MKRVLVVDDDPAMRSLIMMCIRATPGFVAYEVQNGDAAVEFCAEHNPDIVLLDIQMPGLSGVDVCTKLKRAVNPPKVIIVSGTDSPSCITHVFEAGADDFLVKPFDPEALQEKMRSGGPDSHA